MEKKTIRELILEYFHAHPNEELEHAPVVDWVTKQRVAMGYAPPRDPWRMVRQLHQEGKLIYVRKGIYKYDPDYEHEVELHDFTPEVKEAIYKRDNYRCVVCNLGREDGVNIAADHKKPKDKGGDSSFENGQTLCYKHNSMKKNYSQTEAGKRFFKHTYDMAVRNQDQKMIAFCEAVFEVYEEYDMNGHVERSKRDPSLF
jgi:5-methylcytosine-specific restriction endonuclease McrA